MNLKIFLCIASCFYLGYKLLSILFPLNFKFLPKSIMHKSNYGPGFEGWKVEGVYLLLNKGDSRISFAYTPWICHMIWIVFYWGFIVSRCLMVLIIIYFIGLWCTVWTRLLQAIDQVVIALMTSWTALDRIHNIYDTLNKSSTSTLLCVQPTLPQVTNFPELWLERLCSYHDF